MHCRASHSPKPDSCIRIMLLTVQVSHHTHWQQIFTSSKQPQNPVDHSAGGRRLEAIDASPTRTENRMAQDKAAIVCLCRNTVEVRGVLRRRARAARQREARFFSAMVRLAKTRLRRLRVHFSWGFRGATHNE